MESKLEGLETEFDHFKERVSAMEGNYEKLSSNQKNEHATIAQMLNELRDKCTTIELKLDSWNDDWQGDDYGGVGEQYTGNDLERDLDGLIKDPEGSGGRRPVTTEGLGAMPSRAQDLTAFGSEAFRQSQLDSGWDDSGSVRQPPTFKAVASQGPAAQLPNFDSTAVRVKNEGP